MFRVCGTDKLVIVDVHQLPQLFNSSHHVIHIGLWGDALFLSSLLNLLAVFIGTGQKIGIVARQLFKTGQSIGGYGGVGMADV